MTPFAMTGEALAMVGAFKAWLTEIGGVGFSAVAGFTGLNFIGGAVVMAGGAISPHLGHPGVPFMIEMDRLIKIGDIIEEHRIGRFSQAVGIGAVSQRNAGTGFQAFIGGGGIIAGMTGFAIHLGHFPRRRRFGE